MAEYDYDLIVIGAGPGGYVGAIRAAQLGLKTACVEGRETLGGTCLNVGCIPSKALLHGSEKFEEAANGTLARYGVKLGKVELDLAALQADKADAVKGLTQGIEYLFKKNKVDWLKGYGAFKDAHTVTVAGKDYTARNVVIATGSSVTPLPGVEVDNDKGVIVDSTGALALAKVPNHLVVIGGGVIGLELGSVWRRLGADVAVVEFLDRITPGADAEVAKTLQRALTKQGMAFKLSSKVTGATATDSGVELTYEPVAGGAADELRAAIRRLLATGGMADVFEAEQLELGRPVAVKLLYPQLSAQPDFRRRFEVEARAAAGLNHPHVVAVHDYGEQDGTPDGPKMHSINVDPRDPKHLYFGMSSGGVCALDGRLPNVDVMRRSDAGVTSSSGNGGSSAMTINSVPSPKRGMCRPLKKFQSNPRAGDSASCRPCGRRGIAALPADF